MSGVEFVSCAGVLAFFELPTFVSIPQEQSCCSVVRHRLLGARGLKKVYRVARSRLLRCQELANIG